MAVGAELGGHAGRLHGLHRAPRLAAGGIEHAKARQPDLGHIAFLEVGDAVGGPRERERIRGEEVLVRADADHQRAAGARPDHAVRLALREHGNRIGAGEALGSAAHRIEKAAGVQAVHQVRDHLGVSLGLEGVALVFQLGAQLIVVFDDAVMHQRDFAAGKDGVRVVRHRRAVRRPAGVRDAGLRRQPFFRDLS